MSDDVTVGAILDKRIAERQGLNPELGHSLHAVLGSVDVGILVTDLNHKSLICNARFGEIFGIDIAKVVSSDVLPVRSMVNRRLPNPQDWENNLELVYQDASRIQQDELELIEPHQHVRRYTSPVYSPTGEIVARLWTFLDTTEDTRKARLRAELSEIASLFRANPSEVLWEIVQRLSVHYQSIAILSIRNGEFMDFHVTSGLPEEYAHIPGNELKESFCQFCLAAQQPIIIQDAREHPEMQNLLPVQLGCTRYAGVPIRALSGEPIGTLCILDGQSHLILDDHDLEFLDLLAMRINSELEREARIKALEYGLDQTTSELKQAQKRLMQSEKLAVTGTLAASVAHDIRNILASISLQVDIGADRPTEALQYVKGSLGRFDVLAHRLLSYAKPSVTVFEHVDLLSTLGKVVSLVEGQFKINKIGLVINSTVKTAVIQADEGRLEHLFVNLLINALQFSPQGTTVAVTVEQSDAHVKVSIQDEGKGIPPEDIARIFEPFVSTRKDGFGLGLYSCNAIAQDHEGEIECCSELGKGTRFTVLFPRNP